MVGGVVGSFVSVGVAGRLVSVGGIGDGVGGCDVAVGAVLVAKEGISVEVAVGEVHALINRYNKTNMPRMNIYLVRILATPTFNPLLMNRYTKNQGTILAMRE